MGVEMLGTGIWGLLAFLTVQLMRRTRETDRRRDAITNAVAEHERHVSDDRDHLLEELRQMRAELLAVQRRDDTAEATDDH